MSYDVQAAEHILQVGGVGNLPVGELGRTQLQRYAERLALESKLELTEAEKALREQVQHQEIATSVDSLALQKTQVFEQGLWRQRLFVANGMGGISQLNWDEQNGLQLINAVGINRDSDSYTDVLKQGNALYAAITQDSGRVKMWPEKACTDRGKGPEPKLGDVKRYSYIAANDPVELGDLSMQAGATLAQDHGWLYGTGAHNTHIYFPAAICNSWSTFVAMGALTGEPPKSIGDVPPVVANNLFDPQLTRSYAFDSMVADVASFGDYLVAALGDRVQLVHKDSDERITVRLDGDLQTNVANVTRVSVVGNILFASAQSGSLIVIDLNDVKQPRVISAGNTEAVYGVDVYKGRIVAASHKEGLRTLELPGSIVMDVSTSDDDLLSQNIDEALTVRFNEGMLKASLSQPEAAVLLRHSKTTSETTEVDIQWRALDGDNGSAQTYAVEFDRQPGEYRLIIRDAENLRGSDLWVEHTQAFTVTADDVRRPDIHYLENAQLYTDDMDTDIIIHGANFQDGQLTAQISNYPVPVVVDDANVARIPAGSLQMLALEPGQYHLRLMNGERQRDYLGAIMYTAAPEFVMTSLDITEGDVTGGQHVTVKAGAGIFQPGSKVRFVSRVTGEVIETLYSDDDYRIVDLEDDVIELNTFRFRAPGVTYPGIYDVYAVMPSGSGTREHLLGQFSYSRGTGHEWDLPNYPPMQVGGADLAGEHLLVGVKAGESPTETNRFLMNYGFEIYDVTIPDRPVRRSQLSLTSPVLGVAHSGNVAFLAGDRAGLHIVDITNTSQPMVVNTERYSGLRATDVAIQHEQNILALAIADPIGGGYIRFMDLLDEDRLAPTGYPTLTFADEAMDLQALQGQPVDIAWQDGDLHVLHVQDQRLLLTVISGLGNGDRYQSQTSELVNHGHADLADYSMFVESGQVHVAMPTHHYVYEIDGSGHAEAIYWQQRERGGELFAQQGQIYSSTENGFVEIRPHQLAVTSIAPVAGTTVSNGDNIVVQLNSLVDTSEESMQAAVSLADSQGSVDTSAYSVEGINTVNGALIHIALTDAIADGELTLTVNDSLLDLDGLKMSRTVTHQLVYSAVAAPQVQALQRLADGVAGGHYFHADGSEKAIVSGAHFNGDIRIRVGDTWLDSDAIKVLSAEEIQLDIPDLFKGESSRVVNVLVANEQGESVLMGAMVVLPRSHIDEFYPLTGPPEGGNTLDIYGHGFNAHMRVFVGDNQAANLKLLSGNHAQVQMPAGAFGYQTVRVENPYFAGEQSTADERYFYAGKPVGRVNVPLDAPAPIAAAAHQNQILYAVTGGEFAVRNRAGQLQGIKRSNRARLLLVDTSDPVKPEVLSDTKADQTFSYFFEDEEAEGFVDIDIDSNTLVVAAPDHVFIFDITLAASPYLIDELEYDNTVRDVLIHQGQIFIAHARGLDVLRPQDDGYQRVNSIGTGALGGSPFRMSVSGHKLWLVQTVSRKVSALDMRTNRLPVVETIRTKDQQGNPIKPYDFVDAGDVYLVATGPLGLVQAYLSDTEAEGQLASQLRLEYLIANGDMSASRLQLVGQMLYVTAQEGDVQLFNISDWLHGDFSQEPRLSYYYSVMGNATDLVVTPQALYAGTAYGVGPNAKPVENPVEVGVSAVGGELATIENDLFLVVDQWPVVNGTLTQGEVLSLTVNRVVDETSLTSDAVRLLKSGNPLEVSTRLKVSNGLTEIQVLPVNPLENDIQYQLVLNDSLVDIAGNALDGRYHFNFRYLDRSRPRLISISSAYISWRGGEMIDVYGEGFYQGMGVQLGDTWLDDSAIQWVDSTHIRITTPEQINAQSDNEVLAISLGDASAAEVYLAQINVVANPTIETAGRYVEQSQSVDDSATQFVYNSSNRLAVQGKGFGPYSSVTINGEPARNVELMGADMLVFDQPMNMLGTLTVRVDNGNDSVDQTEALGIYLQPTDSNINADRFSRDGDLLATVDDRTIQLFSNTDSDYPNFLSSASLSKSAKALDMAAGYIYTLQDDSNLVVFDIRNVYAPEKVNTLNNPEQLPVKHIRAQQREVFAWGDNQVMRTHAYGGAWEVLYQGETVVDVQADEQYVWVLTTTSVVKIDRHQPAQQSEMIHLAVAAEALLLHHDVWLIVDREQALWYGTQVGDWLGTTQHPTDSQLAFEGELLVEASGKQHVVYDIAWSPEPTLVELTRYRSQQSLVAGSLNYSAGKVEYTTRHRAFSDYYYRYHFVRLPVLDAVPIRGRAIGAEVSLRLSELHPNWSQAQLAVTDVLAQPVNGDSRIVSNNIVFEPANNALTANAQYQVNVLAPTQYVNGVQLVNDRTYSVYTRSSLEDVETWVTRIAPHTMVINQAAVIRVHGVGLESVSAANVGNLTTQVEQVADDGSYIDLQVTAGNASGLLGLVMTTPVGEVIVPAAVDVVKPLSISAVSSDLGTAVSDLGGNEIRVTVAGLSNQIKVYWLPANEGFEQEDKFLVDFVIVGNQVVFSTPDRERDNSDKVGREYQVVIVREVTREQVNSTLLQVVDNTAPRVTVKQPYYYEQDLTLVADEPFSVGQFTVERTVYENGQSITVDVTDQFRLLHENNSQRLRLGNKEGFFTRHNAEYLLQLTGIADQYGNLAKISGTEEAGALSLTMRSLDREAPSSIKLMRPMAGGDQEISEQVALKRSKRHCLYFSAEDNFASASSLDYRYRISSNQGLDFGPWLMPDVSDMEQCNNDDLHGQMTSIPIAIDQADLTLRIEASDGQQKAVRDITVPLKDPEIFLGAFTTEPENVEEVADSTLSFTLTGDAELIDLNAVEVSVHDRGSWRPIVTTASLEGTKVTARAEYFQPKLADTVLDYAGESSVQIPVRLLVPFGLDGQKTFSTEYTLNKDITPPVVRIVSPQHGGFVPWDTRLDVLLQSFDRFGIEQVEVSVNGGSFNAIEPVNRFTLDLDRSQYPSDITLAVRASDPNGNTSGEPSVADQTLITLTPYEAELGEPAIRLVSPQNGDRIAERETLLALVEMVNLEQGTLHLHMGGEANHPDNPAPVTLNSADKSLLRELVELEVPSVDDDTVAVIRLMAKGQVRFETMINVINDDDIASQAVIHSVPEQRMLAGTELRAMAKAEPEIDDQHESSMLKVSGAVGGEQHVAMDEWLQLHDVHLAQPGVALVLDATLQDLSRNQDTTSKTIDVVPFLESGSRHWLSIEAGVERLVGVQDTGHHGFVAAINDVYGGYRLVTSGGIEQQQTQGQVVAIAAKAGRIAVQYRTKDGLQLGLWQIRQGQFVLASEHAIEGQLVGLNGNLVYTQAGDAILAFNVQSHALVAVLGHTLSGIQQVTFEQGRVWVLTSDALHELQVALENDLPAVTELARYAAPQATSFAIHNEQIALLADGLSIWQRQNGELVEQFRVDLVGQASQLKAGAGYWWYKDASNERWYGLEQGEIVAILSAQQLHFSASELLQVQQQDVSLRTLTAPAADEAQFTISTAPYGFEIQLNQGQASALSVVSQSGDALPVYQQSSAQWLLPYDAALSGASLRYIDALGGQQQQALPSLPSLQAELTLIPTSGQLTLDAYVPLLGTLASNGQLGEVSVANEALTSVADLGWLSWHSVDDGVSSLNVSAGVNQYDIEWLSTANTPQGRIDILQPQQNSRVLEGEAIEVAFTCPGVSDVRYVEVRLEDYNGQLLKRAVVADCDARLALEMPALDLANNYQLTVRAYHGNAYNFTASSASFKGVPKAKSIDASLKVPAYVADATQLVVERTLVEGIAAAVISIHSPAGNVLASGEHQVELALSDGHEQLLVRSYVSDGKGNSDQKEYQVQVIKPLQLQPKSRVEAFDDLIPQVGDGWFVRDRMVQNRAGETLVENDQTIVAATMLGRRLLLADEDGITLFDEALEFQAVANHSIEGLQGVVTNGQDLWAWTASEVLLYQVFGNDLKAVASWTVSQAPANAFEHQQHLCFSLDNTVQCDEIVVAEFDADVRWMTTYKQRVWLQLSNAELYTLDVSNGQSNLQGQFEVGRRALPLAGYLAVQLHNGDLMLLSDTLQPSVTKLGSLALDHSGDLHLADGGLWSTSGEHWRLEAAEIDQRRVNRIADQGGRVRTLTWQNGYLQVAADHFGWYSLSNQTGQWQADYESKRFGERVTSVAKVDEGLLFAKPEFSAVYYTQTLGQPASTVVNDIDPEFVTTGHGFVAVSDGVTITVAKPNPTAGPDDAPDTSKQVSLRLPNGVLVTAMDWFANVLWVAGNDGKLYEFYFAEWPIDAFDVLRYDHDLALSEPVRQIEAQAGQIWIRQEFALQRYQLEPQQLEQVPLHNAVHVSQVAVIDSVLWAAYETDNTTEVRALRTDSAEPMALELSYDTEVTALAGEVPYLAVGFVDGTVIIEQVGADIQLPSAELSAPSKRRQWQHGQSIELTMEQPGMAAAANVHFNGVPSYGLSGNTWHWRDLLPGSLANGRDVVAEVQLQDHFGQLIKGTPSLPTVQTRRLPSNDLAVSLSFPQQSYYPAPLVIEAIIENTTHPVQMVEYYLADQVDGRYELIAKHYGPEFVFSRRFDLDKNGYWLKARAVDIYGNYADSTPLQMMRDIDVDRPTIAVALSGAPVVNDTTVVAESLFDVNVVGNDAHSGVQRILLYKGDQLKTAIFGQSTLTHRDIGDLTEGAIPYRIKVEDHANNSAEIDHVVTVLENQPPKVTSARVNNTALNLTSGEPVAVVEGAELKLQLKLQDDVRLQSVQANWMGLLQTAELSDANDSAQLMLAYNREDRLSADTRFDVRVTVVDATQRERQHTLPVMVLQDRAPDASKLVVTPPAAGIFDKQIKLTLSSMADLDDGGVDQLSCAVYSSTGRLITEFDCDKRSVWLSFRRQDVVNNQLVLTVKVTDRFGQSDESSPISIKVTEQPNLLRFTQNAGVNATDLTVGQASQFQVELLDINSVGVPGQTVHWSLIDRLSGQQVSNLGQSSSDDNGVATLHTIPAAATGSYFIRASFWSSDIRISDAHHLVNLTAGEAYAVQFKAPSRVTAGEVFDLTLAVVDAGGNTPVNDERHSVTVALPEGFHFPVDGSISFDLHGQREVAVIHVDRVPMVISLSAAQKAISRARINFSVEQFTVMNAALRETDDHDIYVRSGAMAAVELLLRSDNHQDNPGSVKGIAETGDSLDYRLRLVDQYGNPAKGRLEYRLLLDGEKHSSGWINDYSTDINLAFEAVGDHVLTFEATAPQFEFLNQAFTISVRQRGPGVESIEWLPSGEPRKMWLRLTFNEPLMQELNDNWADKVRWRHSLYNDSAYALAKPKVEGNTLTLQASEVVTYNSKWALDLFEGIVRSQVTGTPFRPAQYDSQRWPFNAPDIYILGADYLLEGDSYELQLRAASLYTLAGVSMMVEEEGRELPLPFNNQQGWRYTHNWDFALVDDSAERTLRFSASDLGNNEQGFGNYITLQLLKRDADFDGDGLSNEFEHQYDWLNPLLADSDGNGINDGDEDRDGDGLSNKTEVDFGTDITLADTDGDLLNDGQEKAIGTKAVGDNSHDTDGDGINDYIEFVSDHGSKTSATDASVKAVDPFFLTAIEFENSSASFALQAQPELYEPQVKVHFNHDLLDTWLDVTGMDTLYSLGSDNLAVVNPNLGSMTQVAIVGAGQALLRVWLTENDGHRASQVVDVSGGDSNLPAPTLRLSNVGYQQGLHWNAKSQLLFLTIDSLEGYQIKAVRYLGQSIAYHTLAGSDMSYCGNSELQHIAYCSTGLISQSWPQAIASNGSAGPVGPMSDDGELGPVQSVWPSAPNDGRFVLFDRESFLMDTVPEVEVDIVTDSGHDETLRLELPMFEITERYVSTQPALLGDPASMFVIEGNGIETLPVTLVTADGEPVVMGEGRDYAELDWRQTDEQDQALAEFVYLSEPEGELLLSVSVDGLDTNQVSWLSFRITSLSGEILATGEAVASDNYYSLDPENPNTPMGAFVDVQFPKDVFVIGQSYRFEVEASFDANKRPLATWLDVANAGVISFAAPIQERFVSSAWAVAHNYFAIANSMGEIEGDGQMPWSSLAQVPSARYDTELSTHFKSQVRQAILAQEGKWHSDLFKLDIAGQQVSLTRDQWLSLADIVPAAELPLMLPEAKGSYWKKLFVRGSWGSVDFGFGPSLHLLAGQSNLDIWSTCQGCDSLSYVDGDLEINELSLYQLSDLGIQRTQASNGLALNAAQVRFESIYNKTPVQFSLSLRPKAEPDYYQSYIDRVNALTEDGNVLPVWSDLPEEFKLTLDFPESPKASITQQSVVEFTQIDSVPATLSLAIDLEPTALLNGLPPQDEKILFDFDYSALRSVCKYKMSPMGGDCRTSYSLLVENGQSHYELPVMLASGLLDSGLHQDEIRYRRSSDMRWYSIEVTYKVIAHQEPLAAPAAIQAYQSLSINESNLMMSFDGLAMATNDQYTPVGFAIKAPVHWKRCSAKEAWEIYEFPDQFADCDLISVQPQQSEFGDQQGGITVYLKNRAYDAVLEGIPLTVQLLARHQDGRQGFYELEVGASFTDPYFDLTIGGLSEGENGKVVEYGQYQLLKDALDLQFQYNGTAAAVLMVDDAPYQFEAVTHPWEGAERRQAYYFLNQGQASGLSEMQPEASLAALTEEFMPGVMLLAGVSGQGLNASSDLHYRLTDNMPNTYLGDSQFSYFADAELDGKQAFIRTFVNGDFVDSEPFTFTMQPFESTMCESPGSVSIARQPEMAEKYGLWMGWLFEVDSDYEIRDIDLSISGTADPLLGRGLVNQSGLLLAEWEVRPPDDGMQFYPNPDKEYVIEIIIDSVVCGEQKHTLQVTPELLDSLPKIPGWYIPSYQRAE
ncbi:hypothetical protein CHH28_16465 [Bacterioplanes sanyensis]|uniref:IPT/TIG domain-containing protein n=1 Tax=Bacterioplanes sanyensis TaxID=1249553 RepID=A0A222FP60_9GAMM|nr:IPT/TIG domain-containing protein [Bacterioplanes sanyensis]ASP40171.1 hypothetical protein CHH28_16465 [Bacterioplanes sanyensis]